MRTKYADFDECPIAIEITFRELNKLIGLIEDVDGPFRRLRSDLKAAKADALESVRNKVDFETRGGWNAEAES